MQKNSRFRFIIAQSLVLLARFSVTWVPDPTLHEKAQYAMLVAVALNTVCEYYQISDLYDYGSAVGKVYKILQEPKYRERAVELSYQVLAAFPKGDLMVEPDVDALLRGWYIGRKHLDSNRSTKHYTCVVLLR